MTAHKTPLNDQLTALGEAFQASSVRVREAQDDVRRAKEKIAGLSEELIEALSRDDAAAVAKIRRSREKAEGAVQEAEEVLAGRERARGRAEGERQRFAAENSRELIAERLPAATEKAADVEAALKHLQTTYAAWQDMASAVAALMRLAGLQTNAMPVFPAAVEQVVRAAKRAEVRIPVPLPVPQANWSISDHDAAEDDVREAAQAKMKSKAA